MRKQGYMLYWYDNQTSTWGNTEHVPVRIYMDEQKAMTKRREHNERAEKSKTGQRFEVKTIEVDMEITRGSPTS